MPGGAGGGHEVRLSPRASRDLNRIESRDLEALRARVLALGADPRPFGVKKLDGPLHRIRVGDWRVLYAIDDDSKRVIVLRVLRRSERTYKSP